VGVRGGRPRVPLTLTLSRHGGEGNAGTDRSQRHPYILGPPTLDPEGPSFDFCLLLAPVSACCLTVGALTVWPATS
jgi:hypothetical protein